MWWGTGWTALTLSKHGWKFLVPLSHCLCLFSEYFQVHCCCGKNVFCNSLVCMPSDRAQMYTMQHRTFLIIFPLIPQTIITSQMMSIGGRLSATTTVASTWLSCIILSRLACCRHSSSASLSCSLAATSTSNAAFWASVTCVTRALFNSDISLRHHHN